MVDSNEEKKAPVEFMTGSNSSMVDSNDSANRKDFEIKTRSNSSMVDSNATSPTNFNPLLGSNSSMVDSNANKTTCPPSGVFVQIPLWSIVT